MIKCKTIAFALAKGGTTKTTSSINLGAALASLGYRVVLVDNDPQSNLTKALGHEPKAITHTLATKMMNTLDRTDGIPIEDCLIHCNTVDLLPSNQKLTIVEKRLTIESKSSLFTDDGDIPAELVMRKTLEPLRERYDFLLIDCPPSAGLLTINALAASDSVLIPMEAHFLGLEAVTQTLELISRVKSMLNPSLAVEGILLTKYQDRTTLCRGIRDSVSETYSSDFRIFEEPIAYSIKAAEQAVLGKSIFETEPHSKIASAYMSAAREVVSNAS
ncbi:MAG: ParA family protein [Oscillospiraceae bacterium]|jgi:chromosome partitioning protein|nr:ParA family protein [Oscillospiraceae bacterium]